MGKKKGEDRRSSVVQLGANLRARRRKKVEEQALLQGSLRVYAEDEKEEDEEEEDVDAEFAKILGRASKKRKNESNANAAIAQPAKKSKQQVPKYPRGIVFDAAALIGETSVPEGKWLCDSIESIIENELEQLKNTYKDSNEHLLESLRELARKVTSRVRKELGASKDSSWKPKIKTKPNAKNLKLQQQETEMRALITNYKQELEELSKIERENISAAKAEVSAKKPPIEETTAIAVEVDDLDKTFDSNLDRSIKQLQVVNAKLRGVKTLVHAGKQTSLKIAHRLEEIAFASYEDRRHPEKLIKSIAQST